MPNPIPQAVGDPIDDATFLNLETRINTQRNRRGKGPIDIDVTDNNAQIDLADYNILVDGYNTMFNPNDCELDPNPINLADPDDVITWDDLNTLIGKVQSAENSCLCNCNNCSCNANRCSCDCNNASEGCTCNCNNSCTCNCNYSGSCSCNCNYSSCPVNCSSHCLCNCDFTTCP